MFSRIVDKSIFSISLLILAWHSNAQSISRGEIVDWLDQTVTMDAPTSGMVISDHNLDLVRPFMPPGYIDEFAYKGSSITIQATKSNYKGVHGGKKVPYIEHFLKLKSIEK